METNERIFLSKIDISVVLKNFENFIARLGKTDVLKFFPKEQNYARKKDMRLSFCILSASTLFEHIVEENEEQIKLHLSSTAISLLLYCDSFHLKLKDISKHCENEQLQYAGIELHPQSFVISLFKEMVDMKYNYWGAHHAGEALGKCFILAKHFKIDLWAEIDKHITQLQTKK